MPVMTPERKTKLRIFNEILENSIDIAYARISYKDQNEARQVRKFLIDLGIEERYIFIDIGSGYNFKREQFHIAKNMLRRGDRLHIIDLKRFGRNYKEIHEQWREITEEQQAHIIAHNDVMLNTTMYATSDKDGASLTKNLVSDIVLHCFSYVAEMDYLSRRKDQRDGIDTWKETKITKTGRPYGRPKIELPENWNEIISLVDKNKISKVQAMKELNLKKDAFYNFYNEHVEKKNKSKKLSKK